MSIYFLAWQDGTAVTADGQRLYFGGLDAAGVPHFTTDKLKAGVVGDRETVLGWTLRGLDLAYGLPDCPDCGGLTVFHADTTEQEHILQCSDCGRVGYS
jgi:hypothetical protein